MSTKLDRLSRVLTWLCVELVDLLLRPVWRRSLMEFEALVNETDCYPCRVCWETGECPQMWIETGEREETEYYGEEQL